MKVTRVSPLTMKKTTLDLPITEEQMAKYQLGDTLIQDAFPNLTPGQREFILTGIPESEWDEAFSDE